MITACFVGEKPQGRGGPVESTIRTTLGSRGLLLRTRTGQDVAPSCDLWHQYQVVLCTIDNSNGLVAEIGAHLT